LLCEKNVIEIEVFININKIVVADLYFTIRITNLSSFYIVFKMQASIYLPHGGKVLLFLPDSSIRLFSWNIYIGDDLREFLIN